MGQTLINPEEEKKVASIPSEKENPSQTEETKKVSNQKQVIRIYDKDRSLLYERADIGENEKIIGMHFVESNQQGHNENAL